MKIKHYNEMMAYLTRPGFNGGGAVSNRTVLPKRKPEAEVKKRKKINYEKIKQYLGKESQELIERELGFAVGGRVNPAQLKQRFMQLVSSIPDAEAEEIPGIVAQAKQIRDQIEEINLTLAPDRQIKITAQGLDFDNPLLDAAKIAQTVDTTQEVTGGLTRDITKGVVPESLTTKNPIYKGQPTPAFPKGTKGTLADPEEKQDPKIDRRVGITPEGQFRQAGMKGRRTDKTLGDYLKNLEFFRKVDPTATEGSFAEGGDVDTPKRGLVDEPGSYAGLEKFEIEKINNPSDEALNEIRQIIDNLDIKQNTILGKEVKNLPKESTVDKLVKQVKTPGYKRPTIAKELFKRILNEKNIKTYDNYRTEKIVTVLNNALDINKGDTLRIKPSAAVKLLPEFEVKNIKGGGGNSILKTYRNYIAGGERIGSRAGIPVPEEIGGRKLADIVTDLDRNFLDVTGGRSVGDMKILNEIKLLDRIANENPDVSGIKLKELFEETGGTNFTERLKKIHPVKQGNLTKGGTGVILKQAAEEGVISNSMPDSLRKAITRYSVDLNTNRFFRQAEKYRKLNPELAYEFTRAMNLVSDNNIKKLGITGAGEHALPISAINTANAPEDIYFKIDAYVDHELNDWKSKNFDQPIFRKKGLAFKYNNADELGLSKKQKLEIQEEIMQRLDFMKNRAPELMENVTFSFTGGKFTANSTTPSILTLDEDGFKALNEKGNRINQKFINDMPDAVKLTSTGSIASIKDKFIKPKKPTPVILGSNLANIDSDLLDFRKIPDDLRNAKDVIRDLIKTPGGKRIARNLIKAGKFTGLGLAGELAFAAPFAADDYASGLSKERIIGNAFLADLTGIGQSEQEEIRKAVGERGYATQIISDLGEKLPVLQQQYEAFNDQNDPGGLNRDKFAKIYNRVSTEYNNAYDLFVTDGGKFDKELYNQAVTNYAAGLGQIEKFRAAKEKERGVKEASKNITGLELDLNFAGGGLAKQAGDESGKPPESGPTPDGPSKGLAYLFKNGMEEEE